MLRRDAVAQLVFAKSMKVSHLIHLDYDVVSLTTMNPEDVGLVWRNCSKISADNFHFMVVEVYSICGLSRADSPVSTKQHCRNTKSTYLLIIRNRCFLLFLTTHFEFSPLVPSGDLFFPLSKYLVDGGNASRTLAML